MTSINLENLKRLRQEIAPTPWYTAADRYDEEELCDYESCGDCYCDDYDPGDHDNDLIVNRDGHLCTWGHQLRLRVEGAAAADKEAICLLPQILDLAINLLEKENQ